MDIVKDASAGTLESSDLLVKVAPGTGGKLAIHVQSEVMKQFGKQIHATVRGVLKALEVEAATVVVSDKGALDCVVKARVQAAVLRAADRKDVDWDALG